MKILYCKDLWWPFGAHLIQTMQRKCYADMQGYKLLYTTNKHPGYSLYDGKLSEFFASISDIADPEIIDFADKNYPQASMSLSFLLNYNDKAQFIKAQQVDTASAVHAPKWHEFKSENFDTVEQYRASVMRKIAEPSVKIKEHLASLPFIQEVAKLNSEYIAVHIRWTDKVNGWSTEADFYDVDAYFKHALSLRETYGINNVVLNCDNCEALSKFLSYNSSNNLNFNILYDKTENLPANVWSECLFQKWAAGKIKDSATLINDVLNGFKIYKTLFEAHSIVCDAVSNMALAPYVARNNKKDINISNKQPYGLIPADYWPVDMFSENVKNKRREGKALRVAAGI